MAELCDSADIARLKEIAKKVYVDYEYIELNIDENVENNEVDESSDDSNVVGIINSYYVYVYGLTQELYVSFHGDNYYYDSANDGVLVLISNSGTLNFDVYSTRCDGIKLHSISKKLSKFNEYSLTEECEKLKDLGLEVCDEWSEKTFSDDIFYAIVNEYLLEDTSLEKSFFERTVAFVKEYYLCIIGGFVLIITIVILYFIHRKRSVLE